MPTDFGTRLFAAVPAARTTGRAFSNAPVCWHCNCPIHPLDTGHAARCSTLQEFARQANR